ncbi:HlyD family secretion protein [Nitrosomonas sp.]|uniref:HlyD family secretion protein n=1 Tax=Nitrosomonas sp. TaxID=42353 RepID=UPI001D98EA08|nr:HlyD family secretion protein [Nitrosomonas sp.]MBX3616077.1 HlyD family efflux transporter periplasmic adaptor subunit [Nitrosomonas sp.]
MKIRFNQPENKIPNDDRGLKIQYSDAKRPGRPWRWYLILAIASLPLVYLIGKIVWENLGIEAHGRIKVTNFIVRAPVEGYVQQIFFKPLEMIPEGVPLAQMVNVALQDSHDRIGIEIDLLTREKQKLLTQAVQSRASSLRLLKYAQEQRDFALNRVRQYETLFDQGAATQAEIATVRSQYRSTLENLAMLEKTERMEYERVRNMEQGITPEMRQLSNQISQLTLEFEKIQDQLKQLYLFTFATGMITELYAQPGEYLSRGQALLEMIFPDQVMIDAFIPPKYQNYAEEGQMVRVKFPNGDTAKARIVAVPGVMQKTSAAEINPLEVVRSAILAQMEFVDAVETRLINGMPVTLYFD